MLQFLRVDGQVVLVEQNVDFLLGGLELLEQSLDDLHGFQLLFHNQGDLLLVHLSRAHVVLAVSKSAFVEHVVELYPVLQGAEQSHERPSHDHDDLDYVLEGQQVEVNRQIVLRFGVAVVCDDANRSCCEKLSRFRGEKQQSFLSAELHVELFRDGLELVIHENQGGILYFVLVVKSVFRQLKGAFLFHINLVFFVEFLLELLV